MTAPNSNIDTHVPRVSVGVPVYNSEKTVRKTLETLLAQTFTDVEIIVSDNGSTDLTEEICREFAARDNRVRYVRQPENRGASANFVFVLEAARSEYFMFAAGDDYWEPTFIEANYVALQQYPNAIASISKVRMAFKWNSGTAPLNGAFHVKLRRFLSEMGAASRFYSLYRIAALRQGYIHGSFYAGDWAMIIRQLRLGDFHEVDQFLMSRSHRGTSSKLASMSKECNLRGLRWYIPFMDFNLWLLRNLRWTEFLYCLDQILEMNLRATLAVLRGRK